MEGEGKTISARLRNPELWELFHQEETEMIITKAGRRMFPVPEFCLAGLEPGQYYGCAIEVIAVDSYRYRHKSSQGWVCSGKGMPLNQTHSKYLHPNSASLGQHWIREGAIFDKLKLSNHILPTGGNIVLNSMQKYRLRLIVTKLGMRHYDRWVFDFPETQFITVTSYQNPRMTQLKIDNNPFAKAFREGKRASRRDGGESKPKKRRTRFPSPPPIIRFQTPFISFLSNQEQNPSLQALPPLPPPPPLSHDWPDEPLLARNIPVYNDFPFSWERDDSLTPQGISALNSSFKVEVNGTFQWRENFPFLPPELPVPEDFQVQPQFPTQCCSVPPPTSAFSLYEDAHVQMSHYLSRDQFWRET
ncbi:T-box transcription factor mls-1-like [Montipora capricornis]|uniref:T-box transcription factor mls-1-like n=1 Tax=Montipora capricornis TaxID=246305 RepID=UPI0035F19AB4